MIFSKRRFNIPATSFIGFSRLRTAQLYHQRKCRRVFVDVHRLVHIQDGHDFGNVLFRGADSEDRAASSQRVTVHSRFMVSDVFPEKTPPQPNVLLVNSRS
jgi:hypothetical protein